MLVPSLTTGILYLAHRQSGLAMEDVTLPQQGPAPHPGGPLSLPLLPHPILLPQGPLMSLAVEPGPLPRLVEATEEELHPRPQGHCSQLSPQLSLVGPSPTAEENY